MIASLYGECLGVWEFEEVWFRVCKGLCCRKERLIAERVEEPGGQAEGVLICVCGGEYVYVCCVLFFVCVLMVNGGEGWSVFGGVPFWQWGCSSDGRALA